MVFGFIPKTGTFIIYCTCHVHTRTVTICSTFIYMLFPSLTLCTAVLHDVSTEEVKTMKLERSNKQEFFCFFLKVCVSIYIYKYKLKFV